MNKEKNYFLAMAFDVTFVTLFIYTLGLARTFGTLMLFILLLFINYFLVLKLHKIYKPVKKIIYPTRGMNFSTYISLLLLFIFYISASFYLNKIMNFADPLLVLLKINIILGIFILLVNVFLTTTIDFFKYKQKEKMSFFRMVLQYAIVNLATLGISVAVFFIIGMTRMVFAWN